MNRLLAIAFLVGLCCLSCGGNSLPAETALEEPTETEAEQPDFEHLPAQDGFVQEAFAQEAEQSLKNLYTKPGHEVLDEISAIDLLSYLSGYYPSGHPFPIIFLDPKLKQLSITHQKFQAHYPLEKLDEAMESYFGQLVEHGYEIEGRRKETYTSIMVDGEEMVVMQVEDLFPDKSSTQKHFSPAQYEFLHNELGPFSGMVYISGYGQNKRNYPLMAGTGYESTARLNLLGPGMAMEFSFAQLDEAFDKFEEYVKDAQ
jgi:hypothetical protein